MLKNFFYDWLGLNNSIFNFFNSFFANKFFDIVAIIIDSLAAHRNFIYYLVLLLLVVCIYIYKNRFDRAKVLSICFTWFEIFSVLGSSLFITSAIIIFWLKDAFHYIRPYCTAGMEKIHIIRHITNDIICNQSFPSGHMSFSTILVLTFWPYFNKVYYKFMAVFFLILVGISRMSSGAHFPADLLYSFLLSFVVFIIAKVCTKKIIIKIKQFLVERKIVN